MADRIAGIERTDLNPFLADDVFYVPKRNKDVIIGSTRDVIMNLDTGEQNGIALLHRKKTIDKEQFVKVFVGEMGHLLDLSAGALKCFMYLLNAIPMNKAEVYIDPAKLTAYCKYKNKNAIYKSLGELIRNQIIAPSKSPNIWFINPKMVFNGDRIAFITEYRLKDGAQTNIFNNPYKPTSSDDQEIQGNSEGGQ